MGCWSSGQEVVTADITSDISCINTSQPQSCPELQKTLGLQLNSAGMSSP